MLYYSTRDIKRTHGVTSAEAIKTGLAPDGGLYMPEIIPHFSNNELSELSKLDYTERAVAVLSMLLTDYSENELRDDCRAAYSSDKFGVHPAPVVTLDGNNSILELWHGPTCAFKDMALQLMPRLLCRALEKTGEKRTVQILVATSGDTGKAALEGCRDLRQVKISVFYPVDGVSDIQKRQMTTQQGQGVYVCAVRGNFDDCQNGVKKIFANTSAARILDGKNTVLSSANSINFGRLVPQVVYYVSAYLDLVNAGTLKFGDKLDVTVPTGNFGNIFAAYIAREMGLPLGKLICASNSNNVLTDFLQTGTYDRNRTFYKTISPSMDILISSNLERLLFIVCGAQKTASYMRELAESGKYSLEQDDFKKISDVFAAGFTSEQQTREEIKKRFCSGYLCDPHTAVGFYVADRLASDNHMLTVSTASPFKFAADVIDAITSERADSIEAPEKLHELSGREVPLPIQNTLTLPVRFTDVIDTDRMTETVFKHV